MARMYGQTQADGYLQLRERLKEKHREKMRKESSEDSDQPQQIPRNNHYKKDNYGSFFGPSVTILAQRVIEQAETNIETMTSQLKSKNLNFSRENPKPTLVEEEEGQEGPKTKTEKIKESRDYSFLSSDDAKVPISIKKEEVKSCVDNKKVVNINKRRVTSDLDSKKQVSRTLSSKKPGLSPTNGDLDSKKQVSRTLSGKKPCLSPTNGKKQIVQNNPSSAVAGGTKLQSEKSEQMEKKDGMSGETKLRKVPVTKEQLMKQKNKFKRMPLSEDEEEFDDDSAEALRELRKMNRQRYGYDPRKYIGMRDDDRNMEASFSEIQKEERRSAKLGKKEDAIELMKIEKEEREEKLRKAKKRKLQAKE